MTRSIRFPIAISIPATWCRPAAIRSPTPLYASLLHNLTRQPGDSIPPGIKRDIEAYYVNLDAPITTKRKPAQWAQVLADLKTLATMPTSTEPEPFPTYGGETFDSKSPDEAQ